MLLDELAKARISEPVEKAAFDFFRTESRTDLDQKLSALGWVPLSGGSFSTVFQNPKKNYILKINKRHDEGYEHFVKLIHQHRNKHFPKISDMKMLTVKDDYYVYLIEKLNKIPERTASKYANCFAHVIDHPYDSLARLFNSSNWSYLPQTTPQIFKRNPGLITALRLVGKYKYIFGNDMHLHNIMYRKDGTIVIIDPYS